MQHRSLGLGFQIRGQFPHAIHERSFESDRALKASRRRAFDALVDVGGERRVVVRDAELLKVVERVASAVAAQPGQGHEFVGGDALVDRRVDQSFDDPDERRTMAFVDPGKAFLGLVERADQERGRKYLGAVLVALNQAGVFKPRDGRLDPRVVGVGVAPERVLVVFEQDLARRRDHFAVPTATAAVVLCLQVPQRPAGPVDLGPGKSRSRYEPELAFHVVRRVEKHATGHLGVATGATRFLQVVLQRARDVGVHDKTHVGLVDAHAERVGRHDDA